MLTYVILACTAVLSAALLISAIKARNTIKNGKTDRTHANLILRHYVFKQSILFIIDGSIIIFFIQVMNIFINLWGLNIVYHKVMMMANVVCMLIIGYAFVHINCLLGIPENRRRSALERWIFGDGMK